MKRLFILFGIIIWFFSCTNPEKENVLNRKEYIEGLLEPKWTADYLEPGFYYTIDDDIKMYSGINGKIIDIIDIHTKIYILTALNIEWENDEIKAFWYKIKYENKTGYIWGGHIAAETYIFDIDGNGTMEYFQYQNSDAMESRNYFAEKNISIHYNGKKISNQIFKDTFALNNFEVKKENELSSMGHISRIDYNYRMDRDGNISFLGITKSGQIFENGEWKNY
jgi:hypothetical protein